ncbi:phage head closure protein [Xylophilus rhododendri]|uniref:Phage head closure protein n=1 Tax=Xylophilus rhododendri TaxID=2697032 RepID=A0A857J8G9_9BURK|nr:phage head closure protein [Xylophilus rhododendri]QHI99361.1 phage head closure protein [Xylophilus rhododendri]
MDSQDRNHRITLQRRGGARDAANQPTNDWGTHRQAWASIRHVSGLQSIKADTPTSVVACSVRIGWCTDVTDAMRVRLRDGTVYAIQAVMPDLQARQFVDLVCQKVGGRG